MALTLIKLATILSITILPLILLHTCSAFSTEDIHDGEFYTVDLHSLESNFKSKLVPKPPKKIRKGAHCQPGKYNICNGLPVNNGTGILNCCKTHCRNVLGDRNNCGKCGNKCGFGQLCCSGKCTAVAYNVNHCGKCNVKCSAGLKCEYGTCGYA